jgi:hypothetical protein
MKQAVMRIFLVALGVLYLSLPGAGLLPRAEAAIASLDRTLPWAAADEESGSDDSGGDEGDSSEEESD